MSSEVEFNTTESWDYARRFAGLLGAVPSSFSSTIRGVLGDWEKSKSLSHGNKYEINRLLKTASVKAPAYYAGVTYFPDKIGDLERIGPEEFLSLYSPPDLCAVIGLVYFYRRAKRMVVADEWPFIGGPTLVSVDLAGLIGFSIPAIGANVALLSLGLWGVAYSTFAIHDKKGFTEHRRELKVKKLSRSDELEMQRWGCCGYQIATVLAQALGFGVQFSECMTRGLSPDTRGSSALDREAYRFAIAYMWHESLLATGKIPNIAHRGEFYPSKGAVAALEEAALQLKNSGSSVAWLEKNKEDISPDLTPALFSSSEKSKGGEEAAEIEDILE